MEPIRFCTIAGVSERTSLKALYRLSRRHPLVEWAAAVPDDISDDRIAWMRLFAEGARARAIKVALHLPPAHTRRFLQAEHDLWPLAAAFGRVQLDPGESSAGDPPTSHAARAIRAFIRAVPGCSIILKDGPATSHLLEHLGAFAGVEALVRAPDIDAPALQDLQARECERCESAEQGCTHRGYSLESCFSLDHLHDALEGVAGARNPCPYWLDLGKLCTTPAGDLDLAASERALTAVSQFVMRAGLREGDELAAAGGFEQKVDELCGLALDWWAGLASGHAMKVPGASDTKAMYLDRNAPHFTGFSPSTLLADWHTALDGSEAGCLKENGHWRGVAPNGQTVAAGSREEALLRARVSEMFGPDLPANPAQHPQLHRHWLGAFAAEDILPSLLKSSSAIGVRP